MQMSGGSICLLLTDSVWVSPTSPQPQPGFTVLCILGEVLGPALLSTAAGGAGQLSCSHVPGASFLMIPREGVGPVLHIP